MRGRPIDTSAAENFVWSAARLVDRHRYSLLFADGPAEPVIDALRGSLNPDGGFGHALEPDLRCPGSQPAPTLYALEILNETGVAGGEIARDARAVSASIAVRDGGIPSVLPGFEDYPHAPWFASGPGSVLTLALVAVLHAGGVSDDDWLSRATDWCWRSIETNEQPGGYWLKYACAFLDVVPDAERDRAAIASLATRVDPSAVAPVGGVEGRRCARSTSHPVQAADRAASSAKPGSRLTSTPSSPNSRKTVAGCSTGWPGRRRRRPTGAGPSRSAR